MHVASHVAPRPSLNWPAAHSRQEPGELSPQAWRDLPASQVPQASQLLWPAVLWKVPEPHGEHVAFHAAPSPALKEPTAHSAHSPLLAPLQPMRYVPPGHCWHSSQTRSLVVEAVFDSQRPSWHTLCDLHVRSAVAVGALASYSAPPQAVSVVQVRSDVVVLGVDSYWLAGAHEVSVAHTRLLLMVGAVDW